MKHTIVRWHVLLPGVLASVVLGLSVVDTGRGTSPTQDAAKDVNHYIGAAKCKSCHKAEETGNQFGAWEGHKHAKAFETLGTPEAKALAAAKGVEDPQKAPECLRCHVTAHGLPAGEIKSGFKLEAGVQCETCHGPGELHMKARMKAAAAGATGTDYVAIPADEILAAPTEATCRTCHNADSPSFKPFCYPLRLEEVRHLNPKKPRTDEELAALMACGCGEACACAHECAEGCAVPRTKK